MDTFIYIQQDVIKTGIKSKGRRGLRGFFRVNPSTAGARAVEAAADGAAGEGRGCMSPAPAPCDATLPLRINDGLTPRRQRHAYAYL